MQTHFKNKRGKIGFDIAKTKICEIQLYQREIQRNI